MTEGLFVSRFLWRFGHICLLHKHSQAESPMPGRTHTRPISLVPIFFSNSQSNVHPTRWPSHTSESRLKSGDIRRKPFVAMHDISKALLWPHEARAVIKRPKISDNFSTKGFPRLFWVAHCIHVSQSKEAKSFQSQADLGDSTRGHYVGQRRVLWDEKYWNYVTVGLGIQPFLTPLRENRARVEYKPE